MPLNSTWTTSSYSDTEGGNCVQARRASHHTIQVRDSKNPAGPALTFTTTDWHTFTTTIKTTTPSTHPRQ